MKKVFISAMLLCSSVLGFAQLVEIQSVDKIDLPEGVSVNQATISPDGSFVVFSQNAKGGLHKMDLASKEINMISANGNSFDLKIASDGTVVFRESRTAENKLRYTSLKAVDARGLETTLVAPTRDLNGFAVNGTNVMTVDNNKVEAKSLNGGVAVQMPVASIRYGQLCIDGKVISPNGQDGASYLWPSISPNGTKVCYYLATKGCYVANIDGSDPVFVGAIRAAKWLNDLTVVGMHDIDDGSVVTSSKLVVASIDGKTAQDITVKESLAMFPTTNGKRIAYSTPMGDLFIINLK
ncbi:MAG: hypothetical protein IKL11_01220 [Muribaculaceae bacterium]|nr:hypothetical protein [Muribaculaceae bacterium]